MGRPAPRPGAGPAAPLAMLWGEALADLAMPPWKVALVAAWAERADQQLAGWRAQWSPVLLEEWPHHQVEVANQPAGRPWWCSSFR